jgi:histidinol-phosphatase (PHP family)
LKVDYHVHTSMCGHAAGTMEESVRAAIELGLEEVGFADHLPFLYTDDPTLSMKPEELSIYVEQVLTLKEIYADRITVRLGIEADYYYETVDRVAKMLEAHSFDYVLGSVHILSGWLFDDPRDVQRYDTLDIDELYHHYYDVERELARSGLFDVLSHPDLVKKFGHRPVADMSSEVESLLRALNDAGMCFEVNTAGLRWPAGEIYPSQPFIDAAHRLGVPVTMGSDAHSPGDVGRDFDISLAALKSAGYEELATFKDRVMGLAPLP